MKLTTAERNYLGMVMDLMVAHRGHIKYTQHRPMRTSAIDNKQELLTLLTQVVSMDCSEFVQLCMHVSGLTSPSGPIFGWTEGNTTTMKAHLDHYTDPGQAQTGAIVIFASPDHSALVRHPAADPLLCSHGNSAGPQMLALSDEQPYHSGPTVFLNVSDLG